MDVLVQLGKFFTGLGVFFIGCAALWWCSIYSSKKK